jgi:phenylalanyl-tRNA synthetase alpha chain
MSYQNQEVAAAAERLFAELDSLSVKAQVLRSPVLRALYERLKQLPPEERKAFGQEVNALRAELETRAQQHEDTAMPVSSVDITAPWDVNTPVDRRPQVLSAELGSRHPLMIELDYITDIFYRMGFQAAQSRELDDDYHMFSSLNFPAGHPARDDYDTFMTDEGFIAPAHTSTMQNRLLKENKAKLTKGEPLAVIIPDRVFRNEDLDARHEHTFYQLEGMYVAKDVTVGNLVATIKTWLSSYFQKDINTKIQPFYFPFTEPSFEFAASCIFCDSKGCNICSHTGWIELGGCGMIHPNVLREAGIDPAEYSGFAWGFGIDRLVMLKYNIEDVRHFHSGKLEFLRQFS